uniref:Envelope glycoprotein L n=1 Tax=Heterorhabditis bacteriophora TaxID=37862 RepID=A0A1I7X0C3_HETBA
MHIKPTTLFLRTGLQVLSIYGYRVTVIVLFTFFIWLCCHLQYITAMTRPTIFIRVFVRSDDISCEILFINNCCFMVKVSCPKRLETPVTQLNSSTIGCSVPLILPIQNILTMVKTFETYDKWYIWVQKNKFDMQQMGNLVLFNEKKTQID